MDTQQAIVFANIVIPLIAGQVTNRARCTNASWKWRQSLIFLITAPIST